MRVVLQRVKNASVVIKNSNSIPNIKKGILILVAFEKEDNTNDSDMEWMANKIVNLRIFSDSNGKMNLSVKDIDGDILLVSQFTLFASTKKGTRPSYMRSVKPDSAQNLYKQFITTLENNFGKRISTGKFGAYMNITLNNDGPVTIMIDSKLKE